MMIVMAAVLLLFVRGGVINDFIMMVNNGDFGTFYTKIL